MLLTIVADLGIDPLRVNREQLAKPLPRALWHHRDEHADVRARLAADCECKCVRVSVSVSLHTSTSTST